MLGNESQNTVFYREKYVMAYRHIFLYRERILILTITTVAVDMPRVTQKRV